MNKFAIILFCAFAASVSSVEFGKNIKVLFSGFNGRQKDNIDKALNEVSQKTCLTFTEVSHADRGPFIRFKLDPSPACYSFLGPQPRGNDIMLSDYCTKNAGMVQKQFMHALGFINEHNRADRDSYVTINLDNVVPSTRYNFRMSIRGRMNMKTKYDYRSVLHYKSTAFSKNGKPTIVAKDGSALGNTKGLSPVDAEKIRANFC